MLSLDAEWLHSNHRPTRYPNAIALTDALSRLQRAVSTPYHRFVPDDISLLDDTVVDRSHLLGHRQLTDVYLLALATAHDARLGESPDGDLIENAGAFSHRRHGI